MGLHLIGSLMFFAVAGFVVSTIPRERDTDAVLDRTFRFRAELDRAERRPVMKREARKASSGSELTPEA